MSAYEYSDRHVGPTDNPPLLNATGWESDDGEIVQFLVTVRNNRRAFPGMITPVGRIRRAIIKAAKQYDIDCAHGGRPQSGHHSKGKRG